MNLSYDRMLRGIPGTGTRDGGMSGQLLAVNLDAIILFKFHGKATFDQFFDLRFVTLCQLANSFPPES